MVKEIKRLLCMAFLFMFVMPLINSGPAYAEEWAKKIKIGVIGPMKFVTGRQQWWGAQMAADEINGAGGVVVGSEKYGIEIVKADSNEILSISDAVMAMEKLITVDKVNFVAGGFLTETVMAMMDVAADHKTIYIGGGGAPALCGRLAKNYDRYKYYFRAEHPNSYFMGICDLVLVEKAATKVREELGIDKPKVALLLVKTKVSDAIARVFKTNLPKLGMEVAGDWRVLPTAADYSAELNSIRNAGAQIIATFLSGPTGIIFSKQWGELRIPAVPVGYNNRVYEKDYWKNTAGMCNYETAYSMFSRVPITKKTIPFWDGFTKRTGQYPSFAAGTYAILYIFKEAIERAGSLDAEAMIPALEKTSYIGPSGKYAFFPKGHKWPHDLIWAPDYFKMVGIQWQNGELVTVWPDGKMYLTDKRWIGVKYKGTKDFKLPPWMVDYWKKKKD
ncbi:MAG: ABC transporter substrate-binding protein [Deltaproteobacteria bacterium]|nr:ABC transporter substrate-binding protein [Deltaproteobacteria bacterium]